jgi:tetratricopeptide (TPR) repeat protein
MHLGDAYHRQGKVDLALDAYRRVLRETPARPGIHTRYVLASYDAGGFGSTQALVHACLLEGRYEAAEERASAALEGLGQVKTERGGYVIPIVTSFFFYIRTVPKTQISLDGLYSTFYNLRGLARCGRAEYGSAAEDFKRGLERLPTGNGNLDLGRLLVEQGNPDEALYHFRRSREIAPNSAVGRAWYAALFRMSGRTAEAEREWDELVRRPGRATPIDLPSRQDYLEALAVVDQAWGRTDEAIAKLTRVVEFNPHRGWTYKRLAVLHLARGDRAAARRAVDRAAELLAGDTAVQEFAREIASR